MKNKDPKCMAISADAEKYIKNLKENKDEPMWRVIDRILLEHAQQKSELEDELFSRFKSKMQHDGAGL